MRIPPAIIAIGRNYADHAAEMGTKTDERPMVFMKNPASVCRTNDLIVIPRVCREGGPQVDYEGELAFEIARDCRDVPEAEAMSVIAGYRVANDVSARWWQKTGSGGQFCRGKSFDTFCPMTDLVPAGAVGDPQDLDIETILNGQTVQKANTRLMVFPVRFLVALRFAPDEELPELVTQVLEGRFTKPVEVKKEESAGATTAAEEPIEAPLPKKA